MNDLKSRLGLLRSELIYVWKPFNRRRLSRFYSQFVHPGALCLDIGAHLGSRSRAFLDLGARVVALEPQPQCIAYLKRRWGDERRFALIPKAIGAQAGMATLHVNRMNPTISTLAPDSWRRAMAASHRCSATNSAVDTVSGGGFKMTLFPAINAARQPPAGIA